MQPFFLDSPSGGHRYCLYHPARRSEGSLGKILYLAPFADEMNKARRMAALQARAFAAEGYEVLQLDPLGCGDSSGDFGDASWQAWLDDVKQASDWLMAQPGGRTLWLWGLRAGCLLAVEAHKTLPYPSQLLLVQPPASGKTLMQQFLRLKVAGEMLDSGSKGLMASLRSELDQGRSVEVAGYLLPAALAKGLEAAPLTPPEGDGAGRRLVWIEVSSREAPEWTPVALQAQQRWRDAGYAVQNGFAQGPAFWQTTEIEELPDLVQTGCRLLREAGA
ncbi:hydrolase 2, exosortase A system-associated [Pelomonas sp. SE-A7]|uniref:hydrolase 2, exosortase A system-associated n=1 Tax=Pelomonas sp. SE-A7 TaxID=3054953 RepID=UPI00259CF7EC|nr:hydrolase 2, exosortase A system-associated [Pelomonas sp. SE-A7]MDM4764898.1 hydrolase 2, exosortase A system-associated [Pelomonas sp. SE-A7]